MSRKLVKENIAGVTRNIHLQIWFCCIFRASFKSILLNSYEVKVLHEKEKIKKLNLFSSYAVD